VKIEIKSPTRIDLAGGTLDCWPLYNFVGETCYTTNLSIDIFTGVKLELLNHQGISVYISDLNYKKEFKNYSDFMSCRDSQLVLIKETLKFWDLRDSNFYLETYSKSPVGGGLGGSSSLVISLLKAFSKLKNFNWNLHKIVTVAHNIESAVLRTPTGTQDYVPAFQPGMNIITYSLSGFEVEQVNFDLKTFSDSMILVFTGKSHHSGINNWQVIKGAVENDSKTLAALKEVSEVSKDMRTVCLSGDWDHFPELFRREYKARLKLSSSFSSPEILQLEDLALKNGAKAVKICGAGGGGCVMVWTPPEKKSQLCQIFQNNGFQVLDANPQKN
jgi:D-glycero-alpha-D-manno-heptose-7-phosphate kinase